MTKKIFRSIFLVTASVLLVSAVIIMGVLYDYFTSVQRSQLEAQTSLAAQGVSLNGGTFFEGLDAGEYRVTWIAADGSVLADSVADAGGMENHADREEVSEALETGTGESERLSATLAQKTLYRAVRLADGTVVRVSVEQHTVVLLVLGMLQPILFVLLGAIVLAAVIANRLAKRIVGPLNAIDLDQPLQSETYEELSPLLTRIEHQHRQIDRQMRELRQKQNEFAAVADGMSEGLVLLNDKGTVLSINPAAVRLFQAAPDCVGRDMLTVDRSVPMQELLREARDGRTAERECEFSGKHYQLRASPVLSGGEINGVCILAFDVSARAIAEQQRREFSANVSHELKTPLHAIMGSAELIEQGLVKPEDLSSFAGRIRSEAGRLLALINDIIRLSQLDEGGPLPKEPVPLLALCEEAADALADEASRRTVCVETHGDNTPVYGVRRLLYEIVYNLCENAIRYNREGGRVDLAVEKSAVGVRLTVKDTGIGIPPEHQSRVFERFYRVDKSHSRETGGTGLGLSIVKHAAQLHGARVSLQSEPDKGTTVVVEFPDAKVR